MQPTRNDIPVSKRKQLIDILNQILSDAVDLGSQCKQAHWNVKGENFQTLHEAFDAVATEVAAAVDMTAERVKQLGGQALGTARVAAKESRLKEYPVQAVDAQEHVHALSDALAAFNFHARRAIDETAGLGDAVTADMLTGIVGGLDKHLWFIESHLAPASPGEARVPGKARA